MPVSAASSIPSGFNVLQLQPGGELSEVASAPTKEAADAVAKAQAAQTGASPDQFIVVPASAKLVLANDAGTPVSSSGNVGWDEATIGQASSAGGGSVGGASSGGGSVGGASSSGKGSVGGASSSGGSVGGASSGGGSVGGGS